MSPHAWIAVVTTGVVFGMLQFRKGTPTDVLFLCGLVVVTVTGVIKPDDALAGFSSKAILAIAGLLVCAAGLRATGVLDWLGEKLLGGVDSERTAVGRLAATLLATSAFVLNTALVAMLMPVVLDWCRKRNIAPSRILIPLSYLTILGGVSTLVGTSTLLVANDQLRIQHRACVEIASEIQATGRDVKVASEFADEVQPMRLFEIGKVGLPCALVGTAVVLLVGPWVLPDRSDIGGDLDDQRREYLVEMLIRSDCSLIGRSVEQAGLRKLPGLFLVEIDRAGEVITPVTPRDILRNGDRLVFTGIVSTIVDLEKIPGLVPAADDDYEDRPRLRQARNLTEVVLSRSSPMIGNTIRDGKFRQRYDAAVVAVHRNGVRLTNKIGNILMEPGDTLLLQTQGDFVQKYRNSREFFLVSSVDGWTPRRHDRALLAGILALVLVLWLSMTSWLSQLPGFAGISSEAVAAITIACLMVVLRCLPISEARLAIDLPLLLTIVGAIGLGRALDASGADDYIASRLVNLVQHPYFLLVILYLLSSLFTEVITNTAVAATMIPLAVAVAAEGGYNPRPFIIAVALSASLSFLTPIGYQTNLMVMGPGGYRPGDYLRLGVPVWAAVTITALIIIPRVWFF